MFAFVSVKVVTLVALVKVCKGCQSTRFVEYSKVINSPVLQSVRNWKLPLGRRAGWPVKLGGVFVSNMLQFLDLEQDVLAQAHVRLPFPVSAWWRMSKLDDELAKDESLWRMWHEEGVTESTS